MSVADILEVLEVDVVDDLAVGFGCTEEEGGEVVVKTEDDDDDEGEGEEVSQTQSLRPRGQYLRRKLAQNVEIMSIDHQPADSIISNECDADNEADTCTVVSGGITVSYDSNVYDFSDVSIAVTAMIQDLMMNGNYTNSALGIVDVSYRSVQLIGGPSSPSNQKGKVPPAESPASSNSQFASVNTTTGAYIIVVCCGVIVVSGMFILYFNRPIPLDPNAFVVHKEEHLYDPKLHFIKEQISETLAKPEQKKQVPVYEPYPTPENQPRISARSVRKMMAKNKNNLSTIEETAEEDCFDDEDDWDAAWDSAKIPYFRDSPQNRPLNEILEDDCYQHMLSPGSQASLEETDTDSMPSI